MQGSLLWDGQAAQLSMRGVPFGGSQWSPRLFPSCTRPNGKRESFFPSFLRVPLSGLCHSKSPCMLDPAVMCAAQVPNLGVCAQDFKTTVFADVPGLLEGAHEGLGLGHEFLRHVSRCRALVHIIDGSSPDPVGDWEAINLELELFNPAIKDKPQLSALLMSAGGCKGRDIVMNLDETWSCSTLLSGISPTSMHADGFQRLYVRLQCQLADSLHVRHKCSIFPAKN
eukprot:scaffold210001_cov23-Tisochrysis_lutea.AAC.2